MSTDQIPSPTTITAGDVVQADPSKCRWGAILAVVDEVHRWGVRAYFLAPGAGAEGGPTVYKPTGAAYIRLEHGDYVRIGQAEWLLQDEPEDGAEKAPSSAVGGTGT